MNTLQGEITSIESKGDLSLVRVEAGGLLIAAVVTDTPASAAYLEKGGTVSVLFKEGDVIIGKDPITVSLRNQFPSTILQIEQGTLLSKIHLQSGTVQLASVITSQSVERLALKVGDSVLAMIKTNEILIADL